MRQLHAVRPRATGKRTLPKGEKYADTGEEAVQGSEVSSRTAVRRTPLQPGKQAGFVKLLTSPRAFVDPFGIKLCCRQTTTAS